MTTEEGRCGGISPDAGRSHRRPRRIRTPSGKLFPYVKATARRKGYVDLKVRRRDGPVCAHCQRKHFPFQDCWSGPLSTRRDRRELRLQKLEAKQLEEAERQRALAGQQVQAVANAAGPQWGNVPRKREGLRRLQ